MMIIGHGELIISAFVVNALTMINYYKAGPQQTSFKKIFYALLFGAFIQLVVYASINTSIYGDLVVVGIASALCVVISVVFSYESQKYLQRMVKS